MGCKDLKPAIPDDPDSKELFDQLDRNKDGGIDDAEFFGKMGGKKDFPSGITVPEFMARAADKHENPEKAFKAFSKNGKVIAPKEFQSGGRELEPEVSMADGKKLFL